MFIQVVIDDPVQLKKHEGVIFILEKNQTRCRLLTAADCPIVGKVAKPKSVMGEHSFHLTP